MSKHEHEKKTGEVKIHVGPDKITGEYCNMAAIHHSRNEFIMDFIFRMGDEGHVVSRVITNPEHAKALLLALEENLGRYEAKFGGLAPEPHPEHLH
jgi:hypothetical protein